METSPQRDGADADRHGKDAPHGGGNPGMPASEDRDGGARRGTPAGAAGADPRDAGRLRTA